MLSKRRVYERTTYPGSSVGLLATGVSGVQSQLVKLLQKNIRTTRRAWWISKLVWVLLRFRATNPFSGLSGFLVHHYNKQFNLPSALPGANMAIPETGLVGTNYQQVSQSVY